MNRYHERDTGMKNRSIFIKLKAFVDAHGYTIQQIQNVTDQQVKVLLSLTDEEYEKYKQYAVGIKTVLIRELRDAADIETIAELKDQIHGWLVSRFPDYTVEKDFIDKANRKVIFYLDGRDE